MALGMEVGLGPGHSVLDGDTAPLPKKGQSPLFSAHLHCGQTAGHQDATLYGGRPQPRRLCVRWGPSPLPLKGRSPQFSGYVYCCQTAAWIKMPLGTEVGLGLRDIVFDVDPATPRKKAQLPPPNFWPVSIVAKWLDG